MSYVEVIWRSFLHQLIPKLFHKQEVVNFVISRCVHAHFYARKNGIRSAFHQTCRSAAKVSFGIFDENVEFISRHQVMK